MTHDSNDDSNEDVLQPLSRAVTTRLPLQRGAAQPDEQTLRVQITDTAQPMPRAALIRHVTRNYQLRRDLDES